MNFYEWTSTYQKAKRQMKADGKRIDSDVAHWYEKTIRLWHAGETPEFPHIAFDPQPGNTICGLQGERSYHVAGCPYYKVFPDMAAMMSEVSIDIPASELHLPYPAFVIQLPMGDTNDFLGLDGQRLKSILVSEININPVGDHGFKVPTKLETGAARALRLGYQFDGQDESGELDFDYTISLHEDVRTMESEFEESWAVSWPEARDRAEPGWWLPEKELVTRIIKLSIATCFFGIDCHEVVMPDLKRKVVESHAWKTRSKYDDAYRDLAAKAQHVKHWTIGSEIALPKPIVKQNDADSGGGIERSHAYMRRGHMRWQACGPGHKARELIFIHPHLCRPDLPMAKSHGYRIPDDQEFTSTPAEKRHIRTLTNRKAKWTKSRAR